MDNFKIFNPKSGEQLSKLQVYVNHSYKEE
jgi:hypothetical protein